ncbi:hypothetical protein BM523_01940 [Alteromonas mediterranea]|uniref:DUF2855 family protein n=1 Tax=Alteromonas mediterranea TaxID=314275 RepID=UPI000903F843|nr:DUF2855 family protein [Alteromonas mediterranea]APD92860.1 hypothetical protein BM523_01940 [Alteromonas mediterranea]APD96474.1 hypothetical protein BM525_01925 [Alteromonas mediterranea]
MKQFQIDKTNPNRFRIMQAEDSHDNAQIEGAGKAKSLIIKIERFAFTANNLTYYMVGDKLGYWQFFPPVNTNSNENWGVIPVWGVGQVISSENDAVEVGSRFLGYFPPAEYLVMGNTTVNGSNLIDCSPHRLKLPQGYNVYRPLPAQKSDANDEVNTKQHEQENCQMLLWPLYATSYCLSEVVDAIPGAQREQLLILSASSKTSLGLAFALKEAGIDAIGVTSEKRVASLEALNVYSTVISYEQLEMLQLKSTVVVDMSGNAQLKESIRHRLGVHLTRYINVGLTHWQDVKPSSDEEFFFAPAHIQQRMSEIGAAEYQKLSGGFVSKAIAWSADWLNVKEREGLSALQDDFSQHQQGQIPSDEGRIYTLV